MTDMRRSAAPDLSHQISQAGGDRPTGMDPAADPADPAVAAVPGSLLIPPLIPLLRSVADKARDWGVAELLRAWGLEKARKRLVENLEFVRSFLLESDAYSRTNPAVRRWMADFETAAHRADAVLELFRYEALRRRAAQNRRHAAARKVLSYFTTNSPVVFYLSIRKKMEDALGMMDELAEGINRFRFLQHAEAPTVVHPQPYYHVDESEIVGRQDEKDQLVKILLDHSHNNGNNNNPVMVLPIVGMGGSGKTILAQLVHNDHRVVHHFELVLWACVSHKFTIKEIIQSIIEVATMKKCDLTAMHALHMEFIRVLGKKRYLLVLDDVWNGDIHVQEYMRSLLRSDAGSGSAIIMTSRFKEVGYAMGTLPPHQISLLDEDQSWELFHRNAFRREVEKEEELISIAKSIVHKCKGLPLAIKAIATLLRSKNHREWSSLLNSDVWKDALTTTGIVHALQLSYDHLMSEAKICFSFCAIFPKDSPMDKDMLIQLWMANDFIVSETRGQQVFDLLVGSFFLQDVEIQKGLLTGLGDEFVQRPTTCKMHDLMHDLADVISGNDCSILQESSCQEIQQGSTYASSLRHKVRHLSLDYVSNNTIAAMKEILAPQPRTVLVFQRKSGNELPLSMSDSKFMSFRALKTFSIKTNMANIKNIRYLDFSYSDISALPEATAILHSLQTLKLTGCRSLMKLPDDMRSMSSLRHVFLDRCDSLERMPEDIGQLSSLQTLTSYIIDSDAGHGIDQLEGLNLGGALSLTELRKVHSAENAGQGNLRAKHDLKRLSLDWVNGHFYSTRVGYEVDANAGEILEALCPHNSLEVLLLSNYTGANFSSWMRSSTLLEHLCELSLSHCQNCKDLPPLWQLPSLVFLRLEGLHNLTSICVDNDDNGESCISPPPFFPKLENMEVLGMPKLERLHQEVAGQLAVVSFPQLRKLNIFRCPVLASVPMMLPLLEDLRVKEAIAISLNHLMSLSVQSKLECEGDILVEPTVGWMPMSLHFSRLGDSDVSLRLKGLTDNIEHFEEELNRIPCRFIKELDIVNCDCLFSSEPPQMQQNIWNHFRSVENMVITCINKIVQWPAVEFRNLNCLQGLHLSDCSNLTGSLPSTISENKNVLPPQLQDLRIAFCNNLVELPKLPASLEKLHISYCPKLVSMPTILGNIKNLRELTLIDCDALATFSDGMNGVTVLRMLWMERCPRVGTLPEGLLQQLPALEILCIRDCPKLEVAFSRGGTYWHLVEAIPERSVRGSYALNA